VLCGSKPEDDSRRAIRLCPERRTGPMETREMRRNHNPPRRVVLLRTARNLRCKRKAKAARQWQERQPA
jgi:hypothetical protein